MADTGLHARIADAITFHPGNRGGTLEQREAVSRLLADAVLKELRPELESAETAEAERDRYAALLAEASDALRAVGKAAITVEPTLKKPYPDAPHTSPWERFMKEPARRAYNLGHQIRRELNQASKEGTT